MASQSSVCCLPRWNHPALPWEEVFVLKEPCFRTGEYSISTLKSQTSRRECQREVYLAIRTGEREPLVDLLMKK